MTAASHAVGAHQVFPLCLGGNVFGWTADESDTFAVLDAYAAAGGNFVDTADSYTAWVEGHTGGESEELIGRWLASRRRRDTFLVATKAGAHPDYKGLSAATVKRAADQSLRRLGVERIGLYYTHFDDESVEVAEIITALDDLVRAGKVAQIGASNISAARLRDSLEFSLSEDKARYIAIQPHYNLLSRDSYEGELAATAAHYGLAAMPYFALAAGFLTGKYRPGGEVTGARAGRASQYLTTERGRRVLAALDEVAAAHSAEVATIALAWLRAQPTVVAPIASARHPEQLPPLLAAAGLSLSADEVRLLTEASDT